MPKPTAAQRAELDKYIQALAKEGNGLTLEDFRKAQILRSARTARRVKLYISCASLIFLILVLGVLFYVPLSDPIFRAGTSVAGASAADVAALSQPRYNDMFFAAVWALALGGLGACASIFLHVLKLMPQETLRSSDEFEVFGRLVLGCLFSTIIALTLAPTEMEAFFKSLHGSKLETSPKLFLPFLAGYSIPLVLKLLEKTIRAVELTIGLDDPRDPTMRRSARRDGR